MNTIPTIFNQQRASYTVVGGAGRERSSGISAILLNRGGRYLKRTVFQELEKAGFDLVVSVEGPRENYDLEDLSIRFPFVKFLILRENASVGEQINMAVDETPCTRFLVLWNDQRLSQIKGAERIADRMLDARSFCVVPSLLNPRMEILPTLIAPAYFRGSIKTVPLSPVHEGAPTLYPFDAVGVYEKDRFIKLGGFDPGIRNLHWQLMDFGFRAHLWGESIRSTQVLRVRYDGDIPAEDATIDEGYKAFYLKNLAPAFRGDSAHLPIRRFPSYLMRSGVGPFDAWSEFAEARHWVEVNRYRFVRDARSVTELWEAPES